MLRSRRTQRGNDADAGTAWFSVRPTLGRRKNTGVRGGRVIRACSARTSSRRSARRSAREMNGARAGRRGGDARRGLDGRGRPALGGDGPATRSWSHPARPPAGAAPAGRPGTRSGERRRRCGLPSSSCRHSPSGPRPRPMRLASVSPGAFRSRDLGLPVPRGGATPRRPRAAAAGRLVARAQHDDLPRRTVQEPRDVGGGEAGRAVRRGGHDDLVVALVRDELEQRVAVRPAPLDAGVGRDARGRRGLLDGLEQRQRELALAGERRVERQMQRDRGEVARDERRVLRAGEAQRGVERGPRQRAPDDREEDPARGRPRRGRARRRAASAAQRRRRPRRPPRPGRRARWSSVLLRSLARSATMRTSTPGARAAAGRRGRARARRASAPRGAARP